MGEVTIRWAGPDDAFIVAALHLQHVRDLGMPPEAGYLDRFVDRWLRERPDRPTWFAVRGGEHAGILEARRVRALPQPHRPDSSVLHVEVLFVTPAQRAHGVDEALTQAMVDWARTTDVTTVATTAADATTQQLYERLGFGVAGRLMAFDLQAPA